MWNLLVIIKMIKYDFVDNKYWIFSDKDIWKFWPFESIWIWWNFKWQEFEILSIKDLKSRKNVVWYTKWNKFFFEEVNWNLEFIIK